MKLTRWILVAGVVALAACSGPSITMPQPDSTATNKPDPKHGFNGYVVPLLQPVVSGTTTG